MPTRCVVGWALTIVFVPILGCGKAKPEPISFGHVFPRDDESELDGAAAAVDDLNADPNALVLGRRLWVYHGDGGLTIEEFRGQVVRMAHVNRLPILFGGATRAQAEAFAAVPEGTSQYGFTFAGAPTAARHVFHLGLSLDQQADYLGRFLQEQKVERLLILRRPSSERECALAERVRKQFAGRPAPTIREVILTMSKLSDAEIARLNGEEPQAILSATSAAETMQLRRRFARPNTPFLFLGEEADAKLFLEPGEESPPVYWTGVYAIDNPPAAEIRKRLQAAGIAEPSFRAAAAFATVKLIAEVCKTAKGSTGKQVLDELLRENVERQWLGGKLTFTKGRAARQAGAVIGASAGRPVVKRRYEP